jgi:hypothetical protein
MKDGLAATARRKPASENFRAAGGASTVREPYLAQLGQSFGKISQDFRGQFATQAAGAQNSRQGNSGKGFCGHSIREFRV